MNVNLLQDGLRALQDRAAVQAEMKVAGKRDEADFTGQVKRVTIVDSEFRRELSAHWDEVGDAMRSQFGELHDFLENEFSRLHEEVRRSNSSLQDLHAKHDELHRMVSQLAAREQSNSDESEGDENGESEGEEEQTSSESASSQAVADPEDDDEADGAQRGRRKLRVRH